MRQKLASVLVFCVACAPGLWARQAGSTTNDNAQTQQEVEQLKKTLTELEQRLATQEKKAELSAPATPAATAASEAAPATLETKVNELDERVAKTELHNALDRLHITGDFRYELHSIYEHIPNHFDGLALQNALVRTLFFAQSSQTQPSTLATTNAYINLHPGEYQQFLNGLTFAQLKGAVGSFTPAQQGQLFGLLQPATFVKGYKYNNNALQTNRLRLNLDAKVADNVSFTGRLSMYKVFGDSTGVQIFNGQPTSLNIDGTTATVPNSDILRVERAYFTWSHILNSPLYLSVGRRPSTGGSPMNLRQDEPRGGTPMGSLIDFQFDGITVGYHLTEKIALRACYGVGYESGFGNGDVLKTPADRLSDTHLIGTNIDLWSTETTLVTATVAKAFDVGDGFNGLAAFTLNPLTGEPTPPVVIRFTPSKNLGGIDLAGFLVQRHQGHFDVFANINWSGFRPINITTPFGGLGSDPFDTPKNHDAYMFLTGARYDFSNDKTKMGFEFNHGSKYWFNFTPAQDDIVAPKSSIRGNVYEAYVTHRITPHFIAKADYIRYDTQWSGSGSQVGAPKKLDSTPVLGFPTFDTANKVALSLIARF